MTVIDEKLKKDIGKRLQELRKEKKMTISQLLDALEKKYYLTIDEKTLRRYENGTYMPKIDNLIALCEFFGSSLDYIIYGKHTSDDESYTWEDTLKRLNRLIYSLVLIPKKEEDNSSPYYGKYYFLAYDNEISTYLSKIESFADVRNYEFETRGKKISLGTSDLDKLTEDFKDYTDILLPTAERLNGILIAAGENPDLFLQNKLAEIARKRK